MRKLTGHIGLTILVSLLGMMVQAQISSEGTPLSLRQKSSSPVPVIQMPKFDVQAYREQAVLESKLHEKPLQFAKAFEVHYNLLNSGRWLQTEDQRIWELAITSEGAYSINLIFSEYRLPRGAKLFLFNEDKSFTLGAFTYKNNKEHGSLAASPVPGQTIYIQLQVPEYVSFEPVLTVGQVSHDFMNIFHLMTKNGSYGDSGDCNVDINCYQDSTIQKVKNSVVRLIVKGNELCTGVLVNNSQYDGTPYLLTANHCIGSSTVASNSIFYFGYESPTCNGPDGSVSKSISGSTLKATTKRLDFSLVELSVTPPYTFKPYYAGWNIDTSNIDNTISIHHPSGDVKKISFDDDPPVVGNFGGGYDYNSHWHIKRWEVGTTEGGSSGGPLFDQNCRVIGNLTGGSAECGNSVDDYFTMISRAWADYPESINQLKAWLDPLKSENLSIDGFDPYAEITENTYFFSNIPDSSASNAFKVDDDWGYWAGHNSLLCKQYAEEFNSEKSLLLHGIYLDVATAKAYSFFPKIRMQVWKDDLNDENIIVSKDFEIDKLKPESDNYIEFDSEVKLSGKFYVGYRIFYTNPQDTFSLNMSSLSTAGKAYVFTDTDGWISIHQASDGLVNGSLGIKLLVSEPNTVNITEPITFNQDVILYPNPVRDLLNIKLNRNFNQEVSVEIVNLNGSIMLKEYFVNTQSIIQLNLNQLPTGLYFIRITEKNNIITKRITVVR